MIDFQNASFLKMKQTNPADYQGTIGPLLIPGETVLGCYRAIRDGVVFTDKRIMAINVQGMTGKKKDITSLPYSKITAFSVETSGVLDMDSELELWFSGLGKVTFEFTANTNVSQICRCISQYALG